MKPKPRSILKVVTPDDVAEYQARREIAAHWAGRVTEAAGELCTVDDMLVGMDILAGLALEDDDDYGWN